MADGDEVVNVDVDAATAKAYGDSYMDAGQFENAIGCYQDAINQGPDEDLTMRCHYNMANAYYRLGDAENCRLHAVETMNRTQDQNIQTYAMRLFYWASTGDKPAGIDG